MDPFVTLFVTLSMLHVNVIKGNKYKENKNIENNQKNRNVMFIETIN